MTETAVETPAAPATTGEVVEKKEIEAAEANQEEKKDQEKEETAEEKAADKSKAGKKAVVKPPPPPPVHKKDFEKDVVYLYQFNRTPAVPSVSPYCLKVETFLKLQGIKYENVDHGGKLRSKRGLLPFVELNGEEIPDSELIVKTLGEKLEKDLDTGMTNEQRNTQHAMTTMVDNHLCWSFMSWYTKDFQAVIKGYNVDLQKFTNSKLPAGVIAFMMKHTYVRKNIRKLKAAGFAGYTEAEMEEFGKRDFQVLSELLGEKEFFFGEDPRNLDLKAFVWLALILNVDKEVACPLRDYVEESCKNLVGMYNRMKDRAWGDHWDEATGEKMDLNPHIPKPEPPVEEVKEEKKEEEEKEAAEEKKEEDKEKKDEKEEKKEEEEKKE